jgi:hypothetical protein
MAYGKKGVGNDTRDRGFLDFGQGNSFRLSLLRVKLKSDGSMPDETCDLQSGPFITAADMRPLPLKEGHVARGKGLRAFGDFAASSRRLP